MSSDDDRLFVSKKKPPPSNAPNPFDEDSESEHSGHPDDSQDSDYGEDEEKDEMRYCLCRGVEDGFMIACDGCNDWFHGKCVDFAVDDEEKVSKYYCPICETKGMVTVWKDQQQANVNATFKKHGPGRRETPKVPKTQAMPVRLAQTPKSSGKSKRVSFNIPAASPMPSTTRTPQPQQRNNTFNVPTPPTTRTLQPQPQKTGASHHIINIIDDSMEIDDSEVIFQGREKEDWTEADYEAYDNPPRSDTYWVVKGIMEGILLKKDPKMMLEAAERTPMGSFGGRVSGVGGRKKF